MMMCSHIDGATLILTVLFWSSSALSRQYHYINVRMLWPEAQTYCKERFTDLATVDSMDDVNSGKEELRTDSFFASLSRKFWIHHDTERKNLECCSELLHRQHYTDLPTIHNSAENNQIINVTLHRWYIWIGLFRDSWEWSDKSNLFFRHWAAGHPSQNSGSGDCVGMSTTNSGKWIHESCDLQRPFICHGDAKLIRNQIVRVKLSCNGKCTLNDPSLQTAVLNEISEKLKSMGLEGESKISWRKSEGGEVFHQERNGEGKRVVLRMQVEPDGQGDIQDPVIRENMLAKINDELNKRGFGSAIKIWWFTRRERPRKNSENNTCTLDTL